MADFRNSYFGRRPNSKMGSYPEERSQKTSHTSNHQTSHAADQTSHVSDHICKPVLVDAQGRKQPIIILPGNTETYVTRTELYTEEVYSSSDDESRLSYSPYRPRKVDNFITKVQTEASQPGRYPSSPIYRRRQSPCPRVEDDDNGGGFGRYRDHHKKSSEKPSGYGKQHVQYHEGYRNGDGEREDSDDEPHKMMPNHSNGHGYAPPVRVTVPRLTNGGWRRSSDDATRGAPPPRDARVSAPMAEIEKAIEFLKEAINLQPSKTATKSRSGGLGSDPPQKDSFTKFIDGSREGARQHGNFRPSAAYAATIDSEEAERRYNGARV